MTLYKKRYFLLLKYAIIQQRFILYQQIMFSFHRSYFEIDFGKMCIGTDCQALSTFLLPIKMLSISVYRTLNEQTKSY